MIDEIIKGLPLHFQKENNIKFYKSLEPAINYIDKLIEELKSQTSLIKAKGIFLDFIGERYKERRSGRNDDEYRKALMSKRAAISGLPTTEFLVYTAEQISGAEVIDIQTRYKGELASQYFRVKTNQDFSKINKFPDLNVVCEAGARMYWDLELSDENLQYGFGSVIGIAKIITIGGENE